MEMEKKEYSLSCELHKEHIRGSPGLQKASRIGSQTKREKKYTLFQDIDRLKKKLRDEENIHRALLRAFHRPRGALPRLPPYLPPDTQELLAEIAVLEEEVDRLEDQLTSYKKNLAQKDEESDLEKSPLSVARTVSTSSAQSSLSLARTASTSSDVVSDQTEQSLNELGSLEKGKVIINQTHSSLSQNEPSSSVEFSQRRLFRVKTPTRKSSFKRQTSHKSVNSGRKQPENKALGGDSEPNKISEDLLKCLSSIFIRISTKNHKGIQVDTLPNSLYVVSRQTEKETEVFDPYGTCAEYKDRDIGIYKNLSSVDALSIDLKRKRNALFLLHKLKLLLGKLGRVNLEGLSHQHKVAFWINTYNSCMMNAMLEHGIPDSPEKVVILMREATIGVGGQTLNAITIEHFILRLPFYVKQGNKKASRGDELKASNTFGLECSEPLLTFALSCGSWSSPAVRVYTASQIESELEAAKREFLQAVIGISKSDKLVIPKLLEWYQPEFAKDLESLLDWICQQLPEELRKEAQSCLDRKSQQPLSELVEVVPYDFTFRYLLQP